MYNSIDPQTVQSLFWKTKLSKYIDALVEITGDEGYREVFEQVLPYTALKNHLYDFAGLDPMPPKPNPDLPLFDIITAAYHMLTLLPYRKMPVDFEEEDFSHIQITGRMLVEELLIAPLAGVAKIEKNKVNNKKG